MALSHYRAGDYHFGFAVRTRMDNVERIIPVAKTKRSKHNSIGISLKLERTCCRYFSSEKL